METRVMNKGEKELRIYELPVELRADSENKRTIEGYACKFDVLSRNLGWFREKIDRNAFSDMDLSDQDVVALFNHKDDFILARSNKAAKTLSLSVDDTGLKFRFDAPNTTAGNDMLENIRLGNVQHCSFAFSVEQDKWAEDEEAGEIRTIVKFARLYDVSPVVNPAYLQTEVDIAKRSYDEYVKTKQPEIVNTPEVKTKSVERKSLIRKMNLQA